MESGLWVQTAVPCGFWKQVTRHQVRNGWWRLCVCRSPIAPFATTAESDRQTTMSFRGPVKSSDGTLDILVAHSALASPSGKRFVACGQVLERRPVRSQNAQGGWTSFAGVEIRRFASCHKQTEVGAPGGKRKEKLPLESRTGA